VAATCPWCNAPRAAGPTCPGCGANYAKAQQIRTSGRAQIAQPEPAAAAPLPPAAKLPLSEEEIKAILGTKDERAVEDPAFEFKLCVAAIPAMLVVALLFHLVLPGLQRNFLGMPIHELGHALSAWFCGYFAIPTLWKTIVAAERGWLMPLVLGGGLGYAIYRAYTAGKMLLAVFCGALLAAQAIGTFYIKESTAQMLFTFGGDGIGMVLATLLMCTFFFGKRTQLYKGALRWGFLAIGAAAFVDMFTIWWKARTSTSVIPFGEIEGVGLSDPMKLLESHGWSTQVMVSRYVTVGVLCLAALALVYAWGVRRAWQKANAEKGSEQLSRR